LVHQGSNRIRIPGKLPRFDALRGATLDTGHGECHTVIILDHKEAAMLNRLFLVSKRQEGKGRGGRE
jgi:hypothetical protein